GGNAKLGRVHRDRTGDSFGDEDEHADAGSMVAPEQLLEGVKVGLADSRVGGSGLLVSNAYPSSTKLRDRACAHEPMAAVAKVHSRGRRWHVDAEETKAHTTECRIDLVADARVGTTERVRARIGCRSGTGLDLVTGQCRRRGNPNGNATTDGAHV